jgi:hypothetical protein
MNDVTGCVAKCDQGDGSTAASDKYRKCQDTCISSFIVTSGTAAPGGGYTTAGQSATNTASGMSISTATSTIYCLGLLCLLNHDVWARPTQRKGCTVQPRPDSSSAEAGFMATTPSIAGPANAPRVDMTYTYILTNKWGIATKLELSTMASFGLSSSIILPLAVITSPLYPQLLVFVITRHAQLRNSANMSSL